uniref:DNA mismatch repair proteins mutS family domain-containing protein n=1 Tax=Panagrolaimus sp. ES5 TaxID=591445 RepID=A0AC34FXG7_9BILA
MIFSSLIEKCIGEEFTDIREDLQHFEKAFDREKAADDGLIVPRRGIDKDYDASLKKVAACEAACKEYLHKVQKEQKIPQITLHGTGKTRYLLEVPENMSKKLGVEFEYKSKRKGFGRYGTKALERLVAELNEAEKERDIISADATRKVFADFSTRKNKWNKVVAQIAILDCLASLAAYANTCKDLGFPMTRPQFDFGSDTPHIEIHKGYHPLLITGNAKLAKTASKFIPNDTVFGKIKDDFQEPLVILLTGPNMSGKTTLMRQVAVLMVLGQMGGLVPAKFMKLTPADRIFSRIGAHDSSFAGQSTFYVELNETNSIIKNATKDSFVVIDELGRGTSTNDGTAIAGAVLRELADNLQCRTFFSTHYFALCDLVQDNQNVRLAHMNFIIENENDEDPTEEDIIVLYNLVNGACKKSYGFFAAKLADASNAGKLLEEQQHKFKEHQTKLIAAQKHLHSLQKLRELCSGEINIDDITKLIEVL